MPKSSRKKRKPIKQNGLFLKKKIALILLICFGVFIAIYGVNYFQLIKSQKIDKKTTEILISKMKQMLDDEKNTPYAPSRYFQPKEYKKLPPVVVMDQKEAEKKVEKEVHLSEIKDYKTSLKIEDKKPKKKLHVDKKTLYSGKPKLAIIIDDVAYAHQVRLIKKIPYKITPSFFPPTKRHPDTVALSKKFNFTMIHLPTEALNFGSPEPKTLKVGDTTEQIRERIRQIKKWFPSIKYYNNHTGSKFTADLQSMDRLIKVMKSENIHFVDSRTTAKTKAPEISKKYGLKLYSRDIFLDNSIEKKLIKKQLRKAIRIAKKKGSAIAIGHPHKNTLEVLINAKHMLRDVELVYIKDL
ncbi:MAG: divergent polysaccharide deacetylase family protein [Sulfurospirillum sp.]|nr:divergent polysaccharide deacetylase family protein [Sulfurospirillum sp.]MBL0703668.1 divergent polysaccharide deacetylase family protein [Sulfurospirillum sp.]